jgi:hypothetical protein
MRKPKSNSVIDGLQPNQKEALERWLFDENVSFEEAAKRVYQDFGVRSSESALRRYWQRRAQQRSIDQIAMTAATVNQAEQEFAKNPAETSKVLLGLLQQIALRAALQGDKVLIDEEKIKTLTRLTDLVLVNEQVEIKRLAEARKREELQLAKERLELELRKYQETIQKVQREITRATKDGAITRETIERIQEDLKLL